MIIAVGLAIATVLIFIRSIYRIVELAGGFSGTVANNEGSFMIFEGPMIIVAVALITYYHPGRVFGDLWVSAKRGDQVAKLMPGSNLELEQGGGRNKYSSIYEQEV
jgi:hypothetical protein